MKKKVQNNRYLVYEILEDGELKFLFKYNALNNINIGDTLAILYTNSETGEPIRRVYYKIDDCLHMTESNLQGELNDVDMPPILHVKMLIDEPIV